jgi:hypothetical protein
MEMAGSVKPNDTMQASVHIAVAIQSRKGSTDRGMHSDSECSCAARYTKLFAHEGPTVHQNAGGKEQFTAMHSI